MYPMTTTEGDRLIETGSDYTFVQIGRERLEEFTEFVFENFVRGIGRHQHWHPTTLDYTIMLQEERALFETGLYIVAQSADRQPLAALRAARWSPGLQLTAERVFRINPRSLAGEWGVAPEAIWHLSQLCVDHLSIRALNLPATAAILLMRGLIRNMLRAAEPYAARYGIMESDEQISAYLLRMMSIRARQFSATREYFGQTFAACIDLDAVRQLDYARTGSARSR